MAFDTAALDVATIGQGITLLSGDCRTVLPTLAANSVQCCVTSPPYWNLRDYGTAQWDGGDAECDHQLGALVSPRSTLRSDGRKHTGPYDGEKAVTAGMPFRSVCGKCGARRIDAQIGLEATPEAFIAQMVAVFREVRRVLRPDGTCWINLGGGYQNKQLDMIPARVALALQADGWILRSQIVWHKPNPMPESTRDRPTNAYEMVYLLTKRSRYYFDADAVREPQVELDRHSTVHTMGDKASEPGNGVKYNTSFRMHSRVLPNGRNCRNVWTIATEAFSAAHFATFPSALAERCIKAGSKLGDTILDPFAGAGTALLVADRLQRNAIGIELNTAYTTMAMERCRADAPLFSSWPPAEDPADQRMAADARQRDLFAC